MIDLVVIPFHDWRKVQREGGRTRDAHFINHLAEHPEVRTAVIANRPVTLAEMLYRRSGWKTEGNVITESRNSRLVKLGEKLFAIDFMENSLVRPAIAGKKWFFRSYGQLDVLSGIQSHLDRLGVSRYDCISFSVYAAELLHNLTAQRKLFDAWDNFLKFPANEYLKEFLNRAYGTYATSAGVWTTNSDENRQFYTQEFGVENCSVIKNGVNTARFQQVHPVPEDLVNLKRPIIGMGLKVTHLLDTNLLNYLTARFPEMTFVLIGQILDKTVFSKIIQRPNFRYLGDKHYDTYSAYIRHFDVCLIPYHTGNKQHGGDAIKFYEYLAANKPVVSTRGNGVTADYPAVWIADSHEEFGQAVGQAARCGLIKRSLPADITWRHKTDTLLEALVGQRETSCQTIIKP